MGSFHEEGEEQKFFDADEDITSEMDCLESSYSEFCVDNSASSSSEFEVWTTVPQSVQERRNKFLNWMGLNKDQKVLEDQGDEYNDLLREGTSRIMNDTGAVLRTPSLVCEFSSSRSSMSSWSNDASDVSEESVSNTCRVGNLAVETECIADELGKQGKQTKLRMSATNQAVLHEEFENNYESSPTYRKPGHRENEVASNLQGTDNRLKTRFLSRLRSLSCIVDRQGVANSLRPSCSSPMQGTRVQGARVQRVKVRHCRKQRKELSAIFMGQEIQAHQGSILTMKFSLDGRYLASAGEDATVRVWQVVEDARSNETDIPDVDPSCFYFTVNHLSELAPLVVEKEKLNKSQSPRKMRDSACVIFPPRVFRILEEPVHQFHGHSGEILDLSWSKNNCLLSSSIDKTVRLWQVGSSHCLNVFPHSNYVTCVQFNPMNNNYFISGSIDGKVRIWQITGHQVVDWADVRDIVTAVCYHPDGQAAVVGSMKGTCRFYDMSDNHFKLEAQIYLHNKKKAPCKRITGFQFFPHDSSKLMVTCADSQLQILHGMNVVGKYKGLRNTGNQLFASFASDGKHIISACEDSNVYMWNCMNEEEHPLSQPKIIRSWERFSANASVAIPWSGIKSENSRNGRKFDISDETLPNKLSFPSPVCFSLAQDFILESFPKGTATWPEEKLLSSSPRAVPSVMHKYQYKFLKSSCQSTSNSHAWDMVIVTAGWDGRIRTFHNYGLPVAV